MTQEIFIANFREQFDMIEDDVVIESSTEFRELEDWDSLVALSIIAMVDDQYDVSISGDDIREANTVGELFDMVKGKKVDAGA